MRRAILIIGAFLLSATAAQAGYSSMGVGTATCAQFAQQFTKNPSLAEAMFFSWAQGYMSGLNELYWRQTHRTKNMQSITLVDQKARLRTYCAEHPSAIFMTAVTTLFLSMAFNPANAAPAKRE